MLCYFHYCEANDTRKLPIFSGLFQITYDEQQFLNMFNTFPILAVILQLDKFSSLSFTFCCRFAVIQLAIFNAVYIVDMIMLSETSEGQELIKELFFHLLTSQDTVRLGTFNVRCEVRNKTWYPDNMPEILVENVLLIIMLTFSSK